MRNLRIPALVGALAAAVVSTGCMHVTYTLNLKPNGSGTVATTIAMSQAMMQQAGPMIAAQGGSLMPTEEALREAAAGMGEGVRFVSSTPYKTAGFEGVTALYAFDDIGKLSLNMEEAIGGAAGAMGGGAMGGRDPDHEPDPDADVKLSFTREGGRSMLVPGMPKVPEPDADQKDQAAAAAQQAEANPQLEAMMKQMLQGMLMEVAINIDGQIVSTNAPFVDGTRVVLLRMDGDELIKSGTGASQLMQMGQQSDMQKMLMQVPGLKIVTQPEVRIEFR